MRPQIPDELVEKIDLVVENSGYNSNGEFIRDAIRHHLDDSPIVNQSSNLNPIVENMNSILVGIEKQTGNPILTDRFNRNTGYNSMVSGQIGSGKTVGMKAELIRESETRSNTDIIVLEALNAYKNLCKSLGGKSIDVESIFPINPLSVVGVDDTYEQNEFDVCDQFIDFVDTYDSTDKLHDYKPVLRKAIKEAYQSKGITNNPSTHYKQSPVIDDVIDVLGRMSTEPETYCVDSDTCKELGQKAVELMYELYEFKNGQLNELFNGKSTIDFASSNITHLNISDLMNHSTQSKMLLQTLIYEIYMYAQSTTNNVWLIIDDLSVVFKNDLKWLETILRHNRHYDFGITFVIQQFDEIVNECGKMAHPILNNISSFRFHKQDEITKAHYALPNPKKNQEVIKKFGEIGSNGAESLYYENGEVFHSKMPLTEVEKELIGL